jgi:DNA-binding NarL/FixJ family response regulator
MRRIRVMLVGEEAMVRSGLRMLIEAEPEMTVLAEASDVDDARRVLERTVPDVVVVDALVPRSSTVPLIRHIAARHPGSNVLLLVGHNEDPAYLRSCLRAGTSGLLARSATDKEFIAAIRDLHGGRGHVPARLIGHQKKSASARAARGAGLTVREISVLSCLAAGLTHGETASRLSVTSKTVETYRTRIARKLGVHTRAELVACALDMGLLRPRGPRESRSASA